MANYFTSSSDCFNKNCPVRNNETSNANYCSCAHMCPNRCDYPYKVETTHYTVPIKGTYANKTTTSNHTVPMYSHNSNEYVEGE